MTTPERDASDYIRGFLDGQALAYCEAIHTGSKLAALIDSPAANVASLEGLIASEGLECFVKQNESRAAVWIYRDPVAKLLIDDLHSDVPVPFVLAQWATGKLFGYADVEVARFIVTSTSKGDMKGE